MDINKNSSIMLAKSFSLNVNEDNISTAGFLSKRRFIARIPILLLLIFLICALSLFADELNGIVKTVLITLSVSFFTQIVIFCFNTVRMAKKEAELPVNKNNQGQIYFYRDKLIYNDKTATYVLKYVFIKKAFETKDYFYLIVSRNKTFPVPKNGFMFPDEISVVTKLLEVKLENRFKNQSVRIDKK